MEYFWLGYSASQVSDGDEMLLVPSCYEMQDLEEDSKEHRAGLLIPAPVQGDCTGQQCPGDGRTHLSDPATPSCGFRVLMLMELTFIKHMWCLAMAVCATLRGFHQICKPHWWQ